MSVFDQLFYYVFKYYKDAKSKNANNIAITYISILQCALIFLLGTFFKGFFNQMHVDMMSQDKIWVLFILTSMFILFKNWMLYTGRKRMIISAKMIKMKSSSYNIVMLWLLPVACIGLAVIIYQAV